MPQIDGPTNLRRWVNPLVETLWTGEPDADLSDHREWPGWLRWTRRIGIGKIPYGTVLYVVNGIIGWILLGTTVAQIEPDIGNPLTIVFGIAVGASVIIRLSNPLAAWRILFAAMFLLTAWRSLRAAPVPSAEFAFILVLYSVGRHSRRHLVLTVGLLTALEGFLIAPRNGLALSIVIAACLVLGYNVRQRRSAQAEVVVVQREAVEQATRYEGVQAVLQERQRIARELHDVVAHHMSVIAIQAEAAPYKVKDPQPELAESLADIRALALEGLTELRRILGVLRTEDSPETAPQPGLDRVGELVAQARAAGLVVESAITGDTRPVPTATGVSAYRILQEALSNAMRHAPGAKVRIETRYGARTLILSVINGPGTAYVDGALGEAGGGHGVIGMTERAAALGGELIAGPTPGGGFAVTATLPLETSL